MTLQGLPRGPRLAAGATAPSATTGLLQRSSSASCGPSSRAAERDDTDAVVELLNDLMVRHPVTPRISSHYRRPAPARRLVAPSPWPSSWSARRSSGSPPWSATSAPTRLGVCAARPVRVASTSTPRPTGRGATARTAAPRGPTWAAYRGPPARLSPRPSGRTASLDQRAAGRLPAEGRASPWPRRPCWSSSSASAIGAPIRSRGLVRAARLRRRRPAASPISRTVGFWPETAR